MVATDADEVGMSEPSAASKLWFSAQVVFSKWQVGMHLTFVLEGQHLRVSRLRNA